MRSLSILVAPLCLAAPSALAAPQLSTVWSNEAAVSQRVAGLGVDAAGRTYQLYELTGGWELRAVDANGSLAWAVPLPAGMVGNDLAVLAGGDVLVVGGEPFGPASIPGGLGQQDALLARFDSAGVLVGARRIGAELRDEARCVAADDAGGYVVGGWTTGQNFGGPGLPPGSGGPSFLARYDAADAEQWVVRIEDSFSAYTLYGADFAANGDVVAAGQRIAPGAFDNDRVRVRVDASTQAVTRTIGQNGEFYTVEAQADGSLLWAGRGYGGSGTTGYLLLEPPAGVSGGWSVHFDEGFNGVDSRVTAAISDGMGGYYASVVDGSPNNFSSPTFVGVARYDATGAETWRATVPEPPFSAFDLPGLELGPLGDVRIGGRWVDTSGPMNVTSARIARLSLGAIGAATCAAQPNSVGPGATLLGAGSDELAVDRLTLFGGGFPSDATVLFLVAEAPALVVGPGGSQGDLCLGGAIGRYVGPGQLANAGKAGLAHLEVEWASLPGPTGPRSALVGETWHFQAWYRDANPAPTSNFTSGLAVTVR